MPLKPSVFEELLSSTTEEVKPTNLILAIVEGIICPKAIFCLNDYIKFVSRNFAALILRAALALLLFKIMQT
jgi:hypothetical protein